MVSLCILYYIKYTYYLLIYKMHALKIHSKPTVNTYILQKKPLTEMTCLHFPMNFSFQQS